MNTFEMPAMSAGAAVDFACEMAAKLRRAGITRFRSGDVEFDVAPLVDEEPHPVAAVATEEIAAPPRKLPRHAIYDARTHGMPEGAEFPHYRSNPTDNEE